MRLLQKFDAIGLLIIILGFLLPLNLFATEISNRAYAGLWHFHSSGGYKGYIALDGQGGCTYFISSAMLSVEATCISRELVGGGLMIFGTSEGSSNVVPEYGEEQKSSPNLRTLSTNITFQIQEVMTNSMVGKLITTGAVEAVNFQR